MKNKKVKFNLIIISCALLIVFLQVFVSLNTDGYEGTDDQSVQLIQEIAPDYKPWANNLFEHKNDLSEQLVFILQLALGVGVIVFYILKQKKKSSTAEC